MKIQAHDIRMQTQHTFSQTTMESFSSFSSFLFPTAQQETFEVPELQTDKVAEPYRRGPFEEFSNIHLVIQKLMDMLKSRADTAETTFKQYYREEESFSMSTQALIKTDKGEMNLNLNFSMSRSLVVDNSIDFYSAFDPLVINLNGDMPKLSSDTFFFDLDNDGKKDQISKLSKDSGFLALDQNGDGKINQGSELFGTLTGDGFKELRDYDEDNNSWIDESDSIFDKLQVWFRGEEDQEKELVALGELGIGAIYLNSEQSQYHFKSEINRTLGELKSSSFFLNEDGSCGNISQIDFTKQEEPLAELLQA